MTASLLDLLLESVESQRNQCADELLHGLEAVVRVLLQATQDQGIESWWHPGARVGHGGRCRLQVLPGYLGHVMAVKGSMAREHLVHDDAQGVDV